MIAFGLAAAGSERDVLALVTALPLVGVFGGLLVGGFTYGLLRRGGPVLCLLGAVSAAALVCAAAVVHAAGGRAFGVPLGEGFFNAFLLLSADRLQIAVVLTGGMILAFVLARWEDTVIRRSVLFGFPCAWALAVWVALLSNGPLRAWAVSLLAVSLYPLVAPDYSRSSRARKLFFCISPLVVSGVVWVTAALALPGARWPREAAVLVWLLALPLPGLLVLWAEAKCASLFMCQVIGGSVSLLLLGDGAELPFAALMAGAGGLVAGAGALVTNHRRRFAFLACLAVLHQGIALAFLGYFHTALRFMALYPLITFGLWAAVVAGRGTPPDCRFAGPGRIPRGAKWFLTLILIAGLGGLVPGEVLGLRLAVFAVLEAGGPLHTALLVCFPATSFLVLVGLFRFLGRYEEDPGAPVPTPFLGAFIAVALAGLNPFFVGRWFGESIPVAGLCFPWVAVAPVAGAALVGALAPRGEGIARLWSGTSPRFERTVLAFTGPGIPAAILGAAGTAAHRTDRVVTWTLRAVWGMVRSVGRAALLIDRRLGLLALVTIWRLTA